MCDHYCNLVLQVWLVVNVIGIGMWFVNSNVALSERACTFNYSRETVQVSQTSALSDLILILPQSLKYFRNVIDIYI